MKLKFRHNINKFIRSKLIYIVIIPLFFILLTGNAYSESSFDKGMKEFKEENYEEALSYFIQARKEAPNSSIPAYFLGLNYKVMENYKDAVPNLRDAVTLVPHVKEALIELVDALYQTDNLVEAKKWIEVGEKEGIQPARLQFLKGLVLSKEGKNMEAIKAFQKAKELDKNLTQQVEFQIASAYMKEGQYESARDRFKFVTTIDPTTDIGTFARDYEKLLSEKLEREKPFRINVGVGYKFDTNVSLKPSSGAVADIISGKEDSAITSSLRASYTAPFSFNTPYLLSFNYAANMDNYFNLHEFNMLSQSITVVPGYNFKNISFSLPTTFFYSWIHNQVRYMWSASVTPTTKFMVTSNNFAEISAGYLRKSYYDNSYTIPPTGAEIRDGYDYIVGAGWTYFTEEHGMLSAKYTWTKEHTKGNNWSYNENKFNLSYLYPFKKRFKLQLSGEGAFDHYINDNTVFDMKRKDENYTGQAALIYEVNKYFDVMGQFTYIRNRSNIEAFDYRRRIYSLNIELKY